MGREKCVAVNNDTSQTDFDDASNLAVNNRLSFPWNPRDLWILQWRGREPTEIPGNCDGFFIFYFVVVAKPPPVYYFPNLKGESNRRDSPREERQTISFVWGVKEKRGEKKICRRHILKGREWRRCHFTPTALRLGNMGSVADETSCNRDAIYGYWSPNTLQVGICVTCRTNRQGLARHWRWVPTHWTLATLSNRERILPPQ